MNIRTKLHRWLLLASLALILTGCGPEKWVVWSPDGEHAFVWDNPNRLIDKAGHALPCELADYESTASWLPDSRRAFVWRNVKAQNWSECADLLGADRAASIARTAEELARLIAGYRGDWRVFGLSPAGKAWKDALEARGESIETIAYYLDQAQPGVLAPLIKAAAEIQAANEQREKAGIESTGEPPTETLVSGDDHVPVITELHMRTLVNPGASDDQLLVRSFDSLSWPLASPTGRAVTFVRNEPENVRLYVMAVQAGAQPVLVDDGAEFAAWSPDGQDLVFTKATIPRRLEKSGFNLGSIARRRVCTPEGDLIAEPEASEDVAGLILPESPARVAWLPDGRILFAGAKFTLPATTQNLPNSLSLFALHLQPAPQIEQVLPDNVPTRLIERLDRFTVSPDGKMVAILGKGGAVSVLMLDTKTLFTLQDEMPQFAKDSSRASVLPSWRNNDELSYVVPAGDPAGSPARAEVVIASLQGGKRVISKSWPDTDFLPPLAKEPAAGNGQP